LIELDIFALPCGCAAYSEYEGLEVDDLEVFEPANFAARQRKWLPDSRLNPL